MLVALLCSVCIEDAQQQLSVLAFRLWEQGPNVCTLWAVLQHALEWAPERKGSAQREFSFR